MHYSHNWRTFLLFISLIFSSISNPPLQCLQIKLGVFLKCSPSFFCCLFCSAFSANVTTNFLTGPWFTACRDCGRSEAGMFPRLRGLFYKHFLSYDVAKLQRIRLFLSSVNMIAKFISFRTSLLITLLCHLILSRRLKQSFRMWNVFNLRKGISYVLFPLISNWPYVIFELIIKRRV